ncbi:V-type ATP synthase subunit K [Acidilobus saccharovorans 345-15]|uniref:V-type ATP synthase subunit K n=1 Tax=Acidilobus saccharovorans (strain DSM 16705 / JCM 18335 / VKM B-2471 / 345-15) TaxID=666510 RepID=D9Q0G2_ACIS3|nr:V-type ATP synthase subunit K [Acidilobus saccharovorans]ADL18800.1 V-type ATP synthase subunit K [Acidilobus saccharovorans 345-15]
MVSRKSYLEGLSLVLREAWSRPKYRAVLILVALVSLAAAIATGLAVSHAQAAATADQASPYYMSVVGKAIGAGLAVGLAGIGGGYAVAVAGASAISAVAEKREIFGTAFLFVVLGEGIAIYGLLVAIIVVFVLPTA